MTPPNRLQNLFDLAKLIRQTGGRGPLGHNQHGKSSEKPSRVQTDSSKKSNKPLEQVLFPRLLGREKTTPVDSNRLSEEYSRNSRSEQREDEHFFLENGYCLTHSRFCWRRE